MKLDKELAINLFGMGVAATSLILSTTRMNKVMQELVDQHVARVEEEKAAKANQKPDNED